LAFSENETRPAVWAGSEKATQDFLPAALIISEMESKAMNEEQRLAVSGERSALKTAVHDLIQERDELSEKVRAFEAFARKFVENLKTCEDCGGSGWDEDFYSCEDCHGEGVRLVSVGCYTTILRREAQALLGGE